MTNSAGAVQARYEYDPYGKRTKLIGFGPTLDMDFGYTGHYHHAPSGWNLSEALLLDDINHVLSRLNGDIPGNPDDDGDGRQDLQDPDHPHYWRDRELERRVPGG